MARKIDFTRVYKVMQAVVITITIAALLIGFYQSIGFEQYRMERGRGYVECATAWRGNPGGYICQDWLTPLNNRREIMNTSFIIGIGLPILFFGGKTLINYIAPRENK